MSDRRYVDKDALLTELYDRDAITQRVGKLIEQFPNADVREIKFGKWVKDTGNYITPGGDPIFVCGCCGGSSHLYGVEFRRRKMICDECGSINSYPWEKTYEEITNGD